MEVSSARFKTLELETLKKALSFRPYLLEKSLLRPMRKRISSSNSRSYSFRRRPSARISFE